MQTQKSLLPQLSVLAIALSAALAPIGANADQTVTTTPLSTAAGVTENVTITATGAIVVGNNLNVVAISNAGTITTLTNSGAILSGFAINITGNGTIGTIVNTGTLVGNIVSVSTTDLTINGGTGTVFGLLGSASLTAPGVILNRSSNVVFASGNTTLNDNIDVGGGAGNVTGATLQIYNTVAVVGNYNQSAGATLQIGAGADGSTTGSIIVADSATIA